MFFNANQNGFVNTHVFTYSGVYTLTYPTTKMTDFYSIYEFTKNMTISNIEGAERIYNRYIHIIQMRIKDPYDAQLFVGEAKQWLQFYQDAENDRLWEMHHKDDYLRDEYDHSEDKFGDDN